MSTVKTAADKHGGGYPGQQGGIQWLRRCGTSTDDMWDNGDGEMGCKDGNGMGKYQQGTTVNLRAYRCSRIMGMADKISGEDSGRQAWWRRCGTTGMDTGVEEMQDVNRRDVGPQIWKKGLEEQRRTSQILTGNNCRPKGVLLLRDNGYGIQDHW